MATLSDRARDGLVLNIDKPAGMTSFRVVQAVRRVTGIRKVGHTGTLDPMATGVLVLCTGRATKQISRLMAVEKQYSGTLKLGIETDTYDAEGQVIKTIPVDAFPEAVIAARMAEFEGDVEQIPPAFSAVKIHGTPSYRMARMGMAVTINARTVHVDRFCLERYDHPDVDFSVVCGKGTYVRSLVHDLGRLLGCGAHLTALRRTRNGVFRIEDAVPLDRLTPQYLESIPA